MILVLEEKKPKPSSNESCFSKIRQRLSGFPWAISIVLYTLSWGWSLLRPNTLYWDDWQLIFEKQKYFLWDHAKVSGRPPWLGIFEIELIPFGVWIIQVLTFCFFFLTGLFLFAILKCLPNIELSKINQIVLLFLILPLNHARIAIVGFPFYSSSYFLFFLGWFILVNYKTTKTLIVSCSIIFLSFKTHSFLFFTLLPFLHYVWLNRSEFANPKKITRHNLKFASIPITLIAYVVLRKLFWPPSEYWAGYQQPTISGLFRWLPLAVPFIGGSVWFVLSRKKLSEVKVDLLILWVGTGATALALMPYFVGRLYQDYISVIALRSDWGNRHQLLLPLGIALCIVGTSELVGKNLKRTVFAIVVVFSLTANSYIGSNFYLDSIKKDQIVELLSSRSDLKLGSEIVILDDTKRFNGRGSTYRDYEWSGLIKIAGLEVASVSGKRRCDEQPNAEQLTLKSETNYLKALATRDLGLYFEIKPCSEVLAQNN